MNLPKVIECVGSDGNLYRQLVKGNDDLRQDAVMQQIFSLVNLLLKENADLRRLRNGSRRLRSGYWGWRR